MASGYMTWRHNNVTLTYADSGPVDSTVELFVGVLDPGKHLTISFKEDFDPKVSYSLAAERFRDTGNGQAAPKGRVSNSSLRHPVLIAFVYESLDRQKWKLLWEGLKSTIKSKRIHWLAIGDSNVILSFDKKRGEQVVGRKCSLFGEFLESSELNDLRFKGPTFTWQRGGLVERLDGAICNEMWLIAFSNSRVTHLSRLKSDHKPPLLSPKLEMRSFVGLWPFTRQVQQLDRIESYEVAELWGIKNGLELLLEQNYDSILTETDSMKEINAIQDQVPNVSGS
ncbi:hypothetical protein Gohar_006759 [Gossypium harknessii]|uniref:RNase H type-1 domain-containing protein n=1 Tax=Gossypium harknessii TaxID=34285 RepID=A0A7J9GEE3_9ROSI|nr:hypothetical protein [Gossypium harknessii]